MTATSERDAEPGPALEGWLEQALEATALKIGPFDRPQGSGFSAETLLFDVTFERGGRACEQRLVLRKETPDPAVYPQQAPGKDVEIDIQYRTMAALGELSEVPVAPLIGYEPDPTILGAPFFVMGFVDGQVPIENPLYTRSGFFVDAAPSTRRAMIDDGLRVLARVHEVDWQTPQLSWLVPPGSDPGILRQLDLWETYAVTELGGRSHPLLERALDWLRSNLTSGGPACLNWGDARPGNMIWQGSRCACVTDFEAVHVGPPELDLGWWLMFDHWVHETAGVDRLPGEPSREEQRQLYAEHAGRPVGDTYYFEVFAAMRYTAIVVRVMNRAVARGQLPADQTIWIDNPAADCLAALLAG